MRRLVLLFIFVLVIPKVAWSEEAGDAVGAKTEAAPLPPTREDAVPAAKEENPPPACDAKGGIQLAEKSANGLGHSWSNTAAILHRMGLTENATAPSALKGQKVLEAQGFCNVKKRAMKDPTGKSFPPGTVWIYKTHRHAFGFSEVKTCANTFVGTEVHSTRTGLMQDLLAVMVPGCGK